MDIAVLNGSPKGKNSVTMQYVYYLQKVLPEHTFNIMDAAVQSRRMERDEDFQNEFLKQIRDSDVVLWAFPLYYLTVNSMYKRFIETVFKNGGIEAFKGKYTASLSTSIHFFDHTAHNYINAVCNDLGMHYTGFFSAAMRDLMDSEKRRALVLFAEKLLKYATEKLTVFKKFETLTVSEWKYTAGNKEYTPLECSKKAVIIADMDPDKANIEGMVSRFAGFFESRPDIVNLRTLKMGPCLGCLKCGFDNICAYEGRDDYIDMYRQKVLKADIVVFACAINDRYLSWRWQRYLERSFFRTHQPTLKGKQTAFIISGPLSGNSNITEILRGYCETMGANLAGIVTDEPGDNRTVDRMLYNLAAETVEMAKKNIMMPVTFLGEGGRRIFRDEIWGSLRFVFQADHRYFKKSKMYDFPHKNVLFRIVNTIVVLVSRLPFLRRRIRQGMKDFMIRPYQRIIEKAQKE